jgi:hypothetical protein
MLDTLRELSINLWSPIGEIFFSISDASNIWFPIISYIIITIFLLIVLKKFLDMTVSGASSLSLKLIWSFLKKLILYLLSISITITIVLSLYFYLESIYNEHKKENLRVEKAEQNLDYLLLD